MLRSAWGATGTPERRNAPRAPSPPSRGAVRSLPRVPPPHPPDARTPRSHVPTDARTHAPPDARPPARPTPARPTARPTPARPPASTDPTPARSNCPRGVPVSSGPVSVPPRRPSPPTWTEHSEPPAPALLRSALEPGPARAPPVPSRHGHARRQDTPGRGSGGPRVEQGAPWSCGSHGSSPPLACPPARPAHLGIARRIERLRSGVKRRRTAVRRSPLRSGSYSAE